MTDQPDDLGDDPVSASQRLRAHRLAQAADDAELAKRRAEDAHRELADAQRKLKAAIRQDQFDSAIWWVVTLARWTVSTRTPPPPPPPRPKPPLSPIARPLPTRIPTQRGPQPVEQRRPSPRQAPWRTP